MVYHIPHEEPLTKGEDGGRGKAHIKGSSMKEREKNSESAISAHEQLETLAN